LILRLFPASRKEGEQGNARAKGRARTSKTGLQVRIWGTTKDITERVKLKREAIRGEKQAEKANRTKSEFQPV